MRALTIAVAAITLASVMTSPALGRNAGYTWARLAAQKQQEPKQEPRQKMRPAPLSTALSAHKTVYTKRRFRPSVHGFHFRNSFKNTVYIGTLKQVTTLGRDGGMSYAAMDYFYHSSFGVPADRETPPDGDVYGEYISNRLMTSLENVWFEAAKALMEPDRASKMFRSGLGNGGNFRIFRSMIDSNKLCNLLLIPDAGRFNFFDPDGRGVFKAGDCHQVTGIGYRDAPDPSKVSIHVYDNKYPDVEMVLVFDPIKQLVHQRPLKPSGQLGKIVCTYKCYWPDTRYRSKVPPNPAHPKVVNDWSGRDLRRWTPRTKDLRSYRFSRANLSGAGGLSHSDFEAVNADGANFANTKMRQCDFRRASLKLANLTGTDLRGSTLNEADLSNASFGNANLGGARLCGAYTRGSGPGPLFVRTALQDAVFNRAQLPRAQFTQAKANKTRFDGANLANASFYQTTMYLCSFNKATLTKASFAEAAMDEVRFENASLSGASFRKANIRAAHFEGADLRNADFSGASLRWVWFDKDTKLTGSKWRGVAFKHLRGLAPEAVTYILQNR